ncbi:MAG TPA: pyridoxamine kinase [Candidatus Rifleibacterium sp.]|nr:pyridoxamine kinase [Candidatus Rifleibacterium sp.]HPT48162.1 pyridoxamine kinase [Candidatus Rifleibacterium sp.]
MFRHPVKRIAAIHDLSGYGRVSLNVVIPVLTSMGFQVCPLPTAVLSSNTEMPGFKLVDLTMHMRAFIEHWKAMQLSFDAIYSGFLGSHLQIEIVKEFIDDFKAPGQLVVIDPVLGDDGRLYDSMTPDMVSEMKTLISRADVVTPNLTEACALLDVPYSEKLAESELKKLLKALSEKGPAMVIITNVNKSDRKKQTFVYAYNRDDRRTWKIQCDYIPANYPGTGDTFTSIVTGCLMQGDSLPVALDRAVQFISTAVRATYGHNLDQRAGIFLEKVLPNLNAPFRPGCFELLEQD